MAPNLHLSAACFGLIAVAACTKRAEPAKVEVPRLVLGVEVGRTTIADARTMLERAGFHCEDASVMAMMREAHAEHGVAAARDGGLPPDEAPAGHEKYLSDPALQQGRVSCTDQLVDEPGLIPAGVLPRVLLVSDRADAPVSLLAIQRTYPATEGLAATADARAMFDGLTRRYGAASESRGEFPAGNAPLPTMSVVRRNWTLPSVIVEALATNVGKSGITVSEELHAP